MALNTRTRNKGAQSALALLPPGTSMRAYVSARGHARLTNEAIIGGAIFAAIFVVALLLGYILIPGGLLLFFVINHTRPLRGVAVTDQGIAVLGRSVWTSRPNKVLALLPPAAIGGAGSSGSVTVALGNERLTFPRKEYVLLAQATASMPRGPMPAAPMAPIPYPGTSSTGEPASQAPFGPRPGSTLPPAPPAF